MNVFSLLSRTYFMVRATGEAEEIKFRGLDGSAPGEALISSNTKRVLCLAQTRV